jgi:hypothetical protein
MTEARRFSIVKQSASALSDDNTSVTEAFSPSASVIPQHLDFLGKNMLTKPENPLHEILMLPWGVRFHKKYTLHHS